MKNQLFINHQYKIISDNENYCFHNEEHFGDGYLTMYPILTSEIDEYLKEGYSFIISDIIPRINLKKNASLEEKLNHVYQMGQMLKTYGELPVSPVNMVIGEEYSLNELKVNFSLDTYVVQTSPPGYSDVTYKYVGEKNIDFRLNRKDEPSGYYVTI